MNIPFMNRAPEAAPVVPETPEQRLIKRAVTTRSKVCRMSEALDHALSTAPKMLERVQEAQHSDDDGLDPKEIAWFYDSYEPAKALEGDYQKIQDSLEVLNEEISNLDPSSSEYAHLRQIYSDLEDGLVQIKSNLERFNDLLLTLKIDDEFEAYVRGEQKGYEKQSGSLKIHKTLDEMLAATANKKEETGLKKHWKEFQKSQQAKIVIGTALTIYSAIPYTAIPALLAKLALGVGGGVMTGEGMALANKENKALKEFKNLRGSEEELRSEIQQMLSQNPEKVATIFATLSSVASKKGLEINSALADEMHKDIAIAKEKSESKEARLTFKEKVQLKWQKSSLWGKIGYAVLGGGMAAGIGIGAGAAMGALGVAAAVKATAAAASMGVSLYNANFLKKEEQNTGKKYEDVYQESRLTQMIAKEIDKNDDLSDTEKALIWRDIRASQAEFKKSLVRGSVIGGLTGSALASMSSVSKLFHGNEAPKVESAIPVTHSVSHIDHIPVPSPMPAPSAPHLNEHVVPAPMSTPSVARIDHAPTPAPAPHADKITLHLKDGAIEKMNHNGKASGIRNLAGSIIQGWRERGHKLTDQQAHDAKQELVASWKKRADYGQLFNEKTGAIKSGEILTKIDGLGDAEKASREAISHIHPMPNSGGMEVTEIFAPVHHSHHGSYAHSLHKNMDIRHINKTAGSEAASKSKYDDSVWPGSKKWDPKRTWPGSAKWDPKTIWPGSGHTVNHAPIHNHAPQHHEGLVTPQNKVESPNDKPYLIDGTSSDGNGNADPWLEDSGAKNNPLELSKLAEHQQVLANSAAKTLTDQFEKQVNPAVLLRTPFINDRAHFEPLVNDIGLRVASAVKNLNGNPDKLEELRRAIARPEFSATSLPGALNQGVVSKINFEQLAKEIAVNPDLRKVLEEDLTQAIKAVRAEAK
jgi:hypothetical protein